LNYTVYQELVAQDAIKVEQIENQVAGFRIVHLIGKSQRDIELREAGQTEPRLFIAGVELVEQAVKAEQALVSILRSKVHAVVVIPECAQCFIDVTIRGVIRIKTSQYVGIILIAKVTVGVEVAGIAITL
jgi:hypothetical protein